MSVIDQANQVVSAAAPRAAADVEARRLVVDISTDVAGMILDHIAAHPPLPHPSVLARLGWVAAGSLGRSHADMVRTLNWTYLVLSRFGRHVERGDRSAPGWDHEMRVYNALAERFNLARRQCVVAGWEV